MREALRIWAQAWLDRIVIWWLSTVKRRRLASQHWSDLMCLLLTSADWTPWDSQQQTLQARWAAVAANPGLGPEWILEEALPMLDDDPVVYTSWCYARAAPLLPEHMYASAEFARKALERFAVPASPKPDDPQYALMNSGVAWGWLALAVLDFLDGWWQQEHGDAARVPSITQSQVSDKTLGLVQARQLWRVMMDTTQLAPALDPTVAARLAASQWGRRWPGRLPACLLNAAFADRLPPTDGWLEQQCLRLGGAMHAGTGDVVVAGGGAHGHP